MERKNYFNLDPISKEAGTHPVGTGVSAEAVNPGAEQARAITAGDDAVVDTLHRLLESCRDGVYGFRECAGHTSAQDIQTLLVHSAYACRTAAMELQEVIQQMGGEAAEGGAVSGALHRGWVSGKGTLTDYSDQAVLDECEHGEDLALAQYGKTLKHDLSVVTRTMVERQAREAQRNQNEIRAMRDALKGDD